MLLTKTAFSEPKPTSKNGRHDGYPRLPMDVGAFLGGGVVGKNAHWLLTGAEARARLEPWLGFGISYEFLYYGSYTPSDSAGSSNDYDIFAQRALVMGRIYPWGKKGGGFFVGIGGGAQWMHGLVAEPNMDCSSPPVLNPDQPPDYGCSIVSYTVKPASERQYHTPGGMVRASIGDEWVVDPVVIGGEITFDVAPFDPDHYGLLPSVRLHVAYRF